MKHPLFFIFEIFGSAYFGNNKKSSPFAIKKPASLLPAGLCIQRVRP